MKKNKNLLLLYILSVIFSFLLIFVWGVIETPDSQTYISAWSSLANGKLDILRTPIYPIFLHLMSFLFNKEGLLATICFQHLVFLISICFFIKILRLFIKKENIIFWITALYALFPAVNTWGNCILTESFAISGLVFLIYLTFRLIQRVSIASITLFTIQLLVLLLLKPAFIYLLPICFVLFVYLFFHKSYRLGGALGLIGVFFASLICVGYMQEFKREYGVFSFSNVSTINNFYIARQYGIIDPSTITDTRLKKDIDSLYLVNGSIVTDPQVLWEESVSIVNSYPLDTISSELSLMTRNKTKAYILGVFDRFIQASKSLLFITPIWNLSRFFAFGLFIGNLFIFLFIYSLFICIWTIKRRYIPWKSLFLYMLGLSNIIVSIIGAQNEWSRLIFPSCPIWLIFFGQICERYTSKPIESIDLQ